MIISRTPFRISFFGGGTDYPAWYRKHGGSVIATTIDKYCYISCRYLPPFFEHRFRVVYSTIENCQTVDEIAHPAAREILRFMKIDRGVEIHHDGDLPARSGIGSSSSFTIGLLHVLHALKGEIVGKKQLAEEGIYIEQEVLKETVGSQDQVLAAHGGFNQIRFLLNGEISVQPLTIRPERLEELNSHFLLFYTGIKRTASRVAETYINNVEEKKRQFSIMGKMVNEAVEILNSRRDIREFGKLLHEAWLAKKSLSQEVSNPDVQRIYEEALASGGIGGKLLGAGGGGFMLLFACPEDHEAIKNKLHHLIFVPFKFERSGSQIIYYDQEADYSFEEKLRSAQQIQRFRELNSISDLKEPHVQRGIL